MFKFISEYGYTDDKCAFQINLSFIDQNLIYKFNKLKFILEFNEELIYNDFPNLYEN